MQHLPFMKRCLELVRCGKGYVAPNPLVGAVIVYEGRIIAEGYHHIFGGPHAEVDAIMKVNDQQLLPKSTLYVNLEPCSHFGKTPPCAQLIIDKGIKKIVIDNTDPNPEVNGNGIRMLENSGAEVIAGVLSEEGKELNKRFFTFHLKKRPYVILKWAQTTKGFIAPLKQKDSKSPITWISNSASRLLVHKWRGEEQAIMAGSNTVATDDPELTTRYFNQKNPLRIIIDPNLDLKGEYKVFNNQATTLLVNTKKDAIENGIIYKTFREGNHFLKDLLHYLYTTGIQSVLVEGGAQTLNGFIQDRLWDEARVFTGHTEFTTGVMAPELNSTPLRSYNINGDQLNYYRS